MVQIKRKLSSMCVSLHKDNKSVISLCYRHYRLDSSYNEDVTICKEINGVKMNLLSLTIGENEFCVDKEFANKALKGFGFELID